MILLLIPSETALVIPYVQKVKKLSIRSYKLLASFFIGAILVRMTR
jgi:hypothetical protein